MVRSRWCSSYPGFGSLLNRKSEKCTCALQFSIFLAVKQTRKSQRKNLCFEFWIAYISSFLPFRPELHMVCMLLHSRNPDWAWENNRCRHLHCPPHPQNSVVFEWLYQWSCWPWLKIAEASLWLKSSHMQCPRSYDMNEQSLSKHERHIVLHLVDSLFAT